MPHNFEVQLTRETLLTPLLNKFYIRFVSFVSLICRKNAKVFINMQFMCNSCQWLCDEMRREFKRRNLFELIQRDLHLIVARRKFLEMRAKVKKNHWPIQTEAKPETLHTNRRLMTFLCLI